MQQDVERFLASAGDGTRVFGQHDLRLPERSDPVRRVIWQRPTAHGRERRIDAPVVRSGTELTDGHLTTYLLYLRSRDYASSTVARKMAAIKSFFHFLIERRA